MASAVSASRQFSSISTVTRDDQPDERDRRRHDRHLQEPGRGLDVAGEARQDAAGLHVPQLRQRQVEQPVEERAPQRQHHLHVQQALAVVLEDADQVGEDDDADERRPGEVEEGQPRLADRAPVLSSTRSMMNRMKSGSTISSPALASARHEDCADRVAVRPEPAQVVAQVLAALGAAGRSDSALGASPLSAGSSSCRRLYFWTNSR